MASTSSPRSSTPASTSALKSSVAANRFLSFFSLLFVTSSLAVYISKNLFISGWTQTAHSSTPLRWVSATIVPIIGVSWAHGRRSLSTSGALVAVVVGFCLALAHYSFFLALLAFFISSSKVAKYVEGQEEGGMRSWLQVLCNGAMATELALLYLLDVGSADLPVDFRHQYRASWLGVAVLGAVACCNGDTWATQLGGVIAKTDSFLITTWQKVPRGTHGAMSAGSLAASILGGMVIGLAYFLGVLMSAQPEDIALAPSQIIVVLIGGIGGALGSLLCALVGASLQFSGRDDKTGKIVDVVRDGVSPICGKMVLDKHSVSLVSSILTGLILPKIALAMGM